MSSNYFESSRGRIYYDKRGLGDPLVLVHGLYVGASGEEYARNVSALQQHFTVYNVDLLGFGSSDAPRLTHSAELHQHILRDFLLEIVGAPVHLIASGSSCGIAVRLGVYDDALLSKLVLIAPVLDPVSSPQFGASDVDTPFVPVDHVSFGTQVSQFLLSTLATGKGNYEVDCAPESIRDFLLTRYVARGNVTSEKIKRLRHWGLQHHGMYAYVSLLNGYFDVDVARWLRYVRPPTLILWGEALGPPPRERLMRPATWSKGKEIVVVPATKHWPHDERSAEVNRIVTEWLDKQTT